ncbi:MAG: GTP 3',8-cyclase MoaA [Anaerolineae bacterium]
MPYRDDFGRAINYLRVSVTDRCNLRCVYCMPDGGVQKKAHDAILRYEEMALVVRAAAGLGISKVRLTGGEPLARLGLAEFVAMVAATPGIDDVSMTTNGTLLARHAAELAAAGLQRVNISLDSLRPERFRQITRRDRLDDVLAGVEAARAAGLVPIKFNTVVVRGVNDDEIVDLARRTITHGWHVRFIELMPIGANVGWAGDGIVPVAEMRRRIEQALGPLQAVHGPVGNGPARYFHLQGSDGRAASGSIGFIGAQSEHFCPACNRLRLTADGRLRPCLLSDDEIDLRGPLRAGAGLAEVQEILARAIHTKPERHHLDEALPPQARTMSEIGG